MGLIELVIVLVVVGVILWLVTTFIPMDANIKKIISVVVLVVVILWLLNMFGVFNRGNDIPVRQLNLGGH